MATTREIESFARRVAERFHPRRIILFGSHARGAPTADSDVDLLVEMPYPGRPWQQATAIRLTAQPTFPLDLLVRAPEELAARIAMGDGFLREIVEGGRVLYEAPDR